MINFVFNIKIIFKKFGNIKNKCYLCTQISLIIKNKRTMKEFTRIKKQDLVNALTVEMSVNLDVFNLVLRTYNEFQESEHDGLDYIHCLDSKDDLIACIKGGLTPEHIQQMVTYNAMGLKYTRFFFYGTNHPEPEQLTFNGLKSQLTAYLDEIVDYIVAYPFDGACRELYTILITNPMIED